VSSPHELYRFSLKLAAPVTEGLGEHFGRYVADAQEMLVFVPFHLYHFIAAGLERGVVGYSREAVDRLLSDEEKPLLAMSIRSAESIATGVRANCNDAADPGQRMALFSSAFDSLSGLLDVQVLKEDFRCFSPGIVEESQQTVCSDEVREWWLRYLREFEELAYNRTFLTALNTRLTLTKGGLSDTSKEILSALRRYDWVLERVRERNFRLRDLLGNVFRTHSIYRYPVGGYSEITPERDELDRVLFTELIYMDEEIGKADLFTIKYCERDLLFLRRDDNNFFGCSLTFIFDFSHLRIFIKDPGERFPEYFLILLFARSVIRVVLDELPEIRTYFIVKDAPPAIVGVLREYIPESRLYSEQEAAESKSVTVYTVFNGAPDEDARAQVRCRIDVDRDVFRMGSVEIGIIGERSARGGAKATALRDQVADAYIRMVRAFFGVGLGTAGDRKAVVAPPEEVRPPRPRDKNDVEKPEEKCYLNQDRVWEKRVTVKGVDFLFVYVPPGEFMMGSPELVGFAYEHPQHLVQIPGGFWLGRYPVTQEQWMAIRNDNPSRFAKAGRDTPVENIKWDDARDFVADLNKLTGGNAFRLPTEAEWEYACRAGSLDKWCFGDDEDKLPAYAWFGRNSSSSTHPVGRLRPNEWGLYDMHGNVWEWCQNPEGSYPGFELLGSNVPPMGAAPIYRGGAWFFGADGTHSAMRGTTPQHPELGVVGFRIARDCCAETDRQPSRRTEGQDGAEARPEESSGGPLRSLYDWLRRKI